MKTRKYAAALALVLPLAFASCSKEKDTKDSDEPFTITANLPEDTAETDLVYIVGEFNGGEEFALGNPKWELKGTATKRSITIDPKDYIGGKTIDDLWCFQSPTRGVEVVSEGVPLIRTGKIPECNVVAWEKAAGPKFDPSGTWRLVGTINDWNEKVGIDMTQEGTAWVAKGVHLQASDEFKFVMDHSWDTNFGAGEPNTKFVAELDEEFDLQPDGGNIKAAAGYYDIYLYPFLAKAKLVDGGPENPPAGNPVSAISLAPNYLELMEGASESLTLTIEPEDADVMSIVWESSDEAVATVTQNGLVTAVSEGTATVSVTVDGLTASCPVTVNRESPPEPGEGPTVYVFNATTWIYVYLYAWADGVGSIETDWPGQFPDNDIPKVDGWSYYRYTLSDAWCAGPVNLIFNDGNSTGQTEDFPITMQSGESYFFYVDNGKAQLIPDPYNFDPNEYVTPEPPGPSGDPAVLYAYDGNGWGSMNIWAWTTAGVNLSTIWPGQAAEATEVIGGHNFYKFTIPGEFTSETENLNIIFCNGAGTSQTADLAFAIKPGQTYYFNVTGTGAEIIDPENFTPSEPQTPDNSWGIAGTMNEWNATAPIAMEVQGDFYVAKGVSLTADTEFKFVQNKSWAVNRGGTFIALGETFELFQDGANIKPGLTGTYDIYINASGAYAYIPNPAE